MHNLAFIDGQNLYLNTRANGWSVDLNRFRIYLAEKYDVDKAYYFIGAEELSNMQLYETIRSAGFVLVFRRHSRSMASEKKGNVDTDIVFAMMKKIAEREKFSQIILVSGDGDYFRTVEYLVSKEKFCKVLAPNRHSMSGLYREIPAKYHDYLDSDDIKKKIALR